MNLRYLTDEALLTAANELVQREREILTSLLHHLREIERRRLYSSLKCSSLFDYLISKLGYSEDQANRRIKAMRLMRDLPAIEEKIATGALSLTNLVLAQTLFSKEKKAGKTMTTCQKTELLSQLENQPIRTAQKIVAAINPEMKRKTSSLDFDSIEDENLRQKLLRVKGLYAHTNANMSASEVLHKLCDEKLAQKSKSPAAPQVNSQAEIRRRVWQRDSGKCTNCGSTHALEIDHKLPRAMGGESTPENLRLLCRSCNQRAAVEYFGVGKMGKYLRSPEIPYSG